MTISVSSRSRPPFEEDVDVLRVAFDFGRDRFVMASDALHPSERAFRPVSLGLAHDQGYVAFEDAEEAEAFARWLRDTDAYVTRRLADLTD